MAEQVIILVHGMGTHAKGEMKKAYTKALKDRAEKFGVNIDSPLKSVDLVEFNYSEYFDAIRKQFAENAQARAKGFSYLAGQGFEEKLISQLTKFEANLGKDDFFYTHWLDVILYGTLYFGEKVRLDFIDLFEKNRKKYGHTNMHVVCYSLGTAVVHDALAKFYREESDPYDDIPDLKTGNFNISSMWTFANVSRLLNLLNGLTDPYSSTVVTGSDGCMSDMVNIRNKYDPFTWFKRYDRRMPNKTTMTNTAIHQLNMHDFYEYVTEPRVARAMLHFFYDVGISEDQFKAGRDAYREGSLAHEAKDLKEMIEDILENPSIESLKEAIEQFKAIHDLIDELTEEPED